MVRAKERQVKLSGPQRPFLPANVSHMWVVCALISSGPLPTVSKGTHVIVPLVENLKNDRWEAVVVKRDSNRLKLSVNSPPTAVIGQYQLAVETSCASGQFISTHDPANDIFVLFNPWCRGRKAFQNTEWEIWQNQSSLSLSWFIFPHFGSHQPTNQNLVAAFHFLQKTN